MNKLTAMVLGSFAGDAFALGPHWIYDIGVMEREFGRVTQITAPISGSYHSGKIRGDFTHYGDQALMLLTYLSNVDEYSTVGFKHFWLEKMDHFSGYIDHATKESIKLLANSDSISGSTSNELGGVARIAPLIYKYSNNRDILQKFVKEETTLTHRDPELLQEAEFLVDLTLQILNGESPQDAITSLKSSPNDNINSMINRAIERVNDDPKDVILSFGQSCSSTSAFPVVIYILYKYHDRFDEALIQNVIAGGDSAARAMIIGMILGAHLGGDAIPSNWIKDMNKSDTINSLLATIN